MMFTDSVNITEERRVAHDMISYRREVDALLVELGFDVCALAGCALSASEVEAIRETTDPGARSGPS